MYTGIENISGNGFNSWLLIGTRSYYRPSEEGDAIHVWQKEKTQRTIE